MNSILRRLISGLAILMLVPFGSAQAAPISGLYNTGVDDASALLADGATDTHYTISPSWIAITDPGAGLPPSFPGAWVANSSSLASRWIAPASEPLNDVDFDTYYDLTLEFTIGAGLDPTTASFTGRWATDNYGDVFLNGGPSLGCSPPSCAPSGYGDWSTFSANSGFIAGLNTLVFHVTNENFYAYKDTYPTNPTGLRVEFLESNIAAIPEPETYAMLLAGLGLMGFVARRRRQKVA